MSPALGHLLCIAMLVTLILYIAVLLTLYIVLAQATVKLTWSGGQFFCMKSWRGCNACDLRVWHGNFRLTIFVSISGYTLAAKHGYLDLCHSEHSFCAISARLFRSICDYESVYIVALLSVSDGWGLNCVWSRPSAQTMILNCHVLLSFVFLTSSLCWYHLLEYKWKYNMISDDELSPATKQLLR